MIKYISKNDLLNKAIVIILLVLLVLMPFGTFLIQIARLFFEHIGVNLPNIAVKALYGWKEVLLMIGLLFVLIKISIEKRFPFKINKLDVIVFFIMLLGLVYGGLLVGRMDRIVYGFRYDFLVFLFYFLARSVKVKKEDILKYFKTIIYLSIPVMLFGIAQTFILPRGFMTIFGYSISDSVTGNPLPPYHLVGNTVRAMATFPGPNSLAMYSVFIFFAVLFFGKDLLNKYLKYLLLVLSFLTLVLTFSRGHIFSLFAAAFFTLIFFRYLLKTKETIKKNFFTYRSVIATIVLIALSVIIFAGTFLLADLSKNQKSTIGTIILRESSTEMHSFMRNLAIIPIEKQPWGYGIGTAGLATTNIADAKFNPESWPVQLVFEYGFLGLIFFILIIYAALNLFFRLFIQNKDLRQRRLVLFFATFFIAIIVSTNFLPSWFEVGSLMWWILLGLYLSDQFKNNN